jgi:hypothetical protein
MHDPGVVMFFAQVAGDGSLRNARLPGRRIRTSRGAHEARVSRPDIRIFGIGGRRNRGPLHEAVNAAFVDVFAGDFAKKP